VTSDRNDRSQIRYARLAGVMYLLVDAAYLTFVLITARFRVPGDFTETAHRVAASELVYRVGLSSGLVASLCIVFLAMGLYVALKPIDSQLALLAMVFRLLEAAFVGGQAVLAFVVSRLYVGADSLDAFHETQLSFFITLHSAADQVAFSSLGVFFGIGSALSFYLLLKSAYIPGPLAVWGLLGSVLVPMSCLGSLVLPQHASTLQLGWAPIGLAEVVVGLWLVFKGVSHQAAAPTRSLTK
jgi:Domain of unknown function (DUF4386)